MSDSSSFDLSQELQNLIMGNNNDTIGSTTGLDITDNRSTIQHIEIGSIIETPSSSSPSSQQSKEMNSISKPNNQITKLQSKLHKINQDLSSLKQEMKGLDNNTPMKPTKTAGLVCMEKHELIQLVKTEIQN